MLEAQRRNARIVHPRAGDAACHDLIAQFPPVLRALGEEHQTRRLEPSFDLIEGCLGRRRGIPDPRVGGDRQELVDAGPGQGPRRPRLGQLADAGGGPFVPFRFGPVRVDKEVRVDGDQPPWPS